MKKFIQICSVLTLLVAFTVVASAKTEVGFGTEVEIPFAFNVGDKSYEAGTYIIKFGRLSAETATLSIQDVKEGKLQTVLVNVNNESGAGDMRLVFETINGQKYLSKVRHNDKTFALLKVKSEKNASVGAGADASIGGSANLF
jgi:predicted small secreted protein